MSNSIELRKKRDLGEILSDTFAFVRQNMAALFRVLLKSTGIFFLINVLCAGIYQYANTSLLLLNDTPMFFGALILLLVGSILYYASATSAIYTFMQSYMTSDGQVDEQAVVRSANGKMAQVILLSIFAYVMVFLGLIFLIIPGIYLVVPVALAYPIFFFKTPGKRASIQEAFKLVSGYWWVTFGTIIVVSILIGIISFVFQLPASAYLGFKTFFSASDGGGLDVLSGDFIYLFLSSIGSAAGSVMSIFLIIAMAFVYFDLDEEKNRTGIRSKLESLG